jgi:hypothetical protein
MRYLIPFPPETPKVSPFPVPEMKDSGKRQEFSTGAVRDTADGKPRWSLLPPCVWEADACYAKGEASDLAKCVVDFLKTGNVFFLEFSLPHLLGSNDGLQRLTDWLAKGAEKYSPFNWVKGIPVSRCVDSLGRHFSALCSGKTDEDHYAAALCNIVFIITYYGQDNKELLDFPGYGYPDLTNQAPAQTK